MKIAYADPPYPGCAHLYKNHPDYAGEVDHADLIERLCDEYADGWALSTTSTALRDLLPMCPPTARVAAWVKPFAAFKNQRVTFAWEPVIFDSRAGAAERTSDGFLRDWFSMSPQVFTNGARTGVPGTKPRGFCFWVFGLIGARPGDEFHDLFPGSGQVLDAWRAWCSQLRLDLSASKERESSDASLSSLSRRVP